MALCRASPTRLNYRASATLLRAARLLVALAEGTRVCHIKAWKPIFCVVKLRIASYGIHDSLLLLGHRCKRPHYDFPYILHHLLGNDALGHSEQNELGVADRDRGTHGSHADCEERVHLRAWCCVTYTVPHLSKIMP